MKNEAIQKESGGKQRKKLMLLAMSIILSSEAV